MLTKTYENIEILERESSTAINQATKVALVFIQKYMNKLVIFR